MAGVAEAGAGERGRAGGRGGGGREAGGRGERSGGRALAMIIIILPSRLSNCTTVTTFYPHRAIASLPPLPCLGQGQEGPWLAE